MKLYDRYNFDGDGYQKLFHYNDWRIAELKYIEEIDSTELNFLECHEETDEVFVLLQGSCRIWFFENNDHENDAFHHFDLKQHEVFRIPKGVYHGHRVSKDAKILLIEEENTNDLNSTRVYLNEDQLKKVKGN